MNTVVKNGFRVVRSEREPWGTDGLVHGFSTREGGVSSLPYLQSMNFGFRLGEDREITLQNYSRFAALIGADPDGVVSAEQTHSATVLTVDRSCRGLGLRIPVRAVLSEDLIENGYDAMVTADTGVFLSVRCADCVPILFADKNHHVIGAAHAGWRGTKNGIAVRTLQKMQEIGAEAGDVYVLIGPCIRQCCYEVDGAFYKTFLSDLGEDVCRDAFIPVLSSDGQQKYMCNLPLINTRLLENCGVLPQHIDSDAPCTCCNPQLFHSHRHAVKFADGKRGLGCGMIGFCK